MIEGNDMNMTKSGAYIQALSIARTKLKNDFTTFTNPGIVGDYIDNLTSTLITDQMIDCWSNSELDADEQEYEIRMTFMADVTAMFDRMVKTQITALQRLIADFS
jgi:hypothetical protein